MSKPVNPSTLRPLVYVDVSVGQSNGNVDANKMGAGWRVLLGRDGAEAGPGEGADFGGDLVGVKLVT